MSNELYVPLTHFNQFIEGVLKRHNIEPHHEHAAVKVRAHLERVIRDELSGVTVAETEQLLLDIIRLAVLAKLFEDAIISFELNTMKEEG